MTFQDVVFKVFEIIIKVRFLEQVSPTNGKSEKSQGSRAYNASSKKPREFISFRKQLMVIL